MKQYWMAQDGSEDLGSYLLIECIHVYNITQHRNLAIEFKNEILNVSKNWYISHD